MTKNLLLPKNPSVWSSCQVNMWYLGFDFVKFGIFWRNIRVSVFINSSRPHDSPTAKSPLAKRRPKSPNPLPRSDRRLQTECQEDPSTSGHSWGIGLFVSKTLLLMSQDNDHRTVSLYSGCFSLQHFFANSASRYPGWSLWSRSKSAKGWERDLVVCMFLTWMNMKSEDSQSVMKSWHATPLLTLTPRSLKAVWGQSGGHGRQVSKPKISLYTNEPSLFVSFVLMAL